MSAPIEVLAKALAALMEETVRSGDHESAAYRGAVQALTITGTLSFASWTCPYCGNHQGPHHWACLLCDRPRVI